MRLRGLRGLTLVEILVVIVTMAVLMAILFPLAQSAYTSAHRSACMTNMQNLAQAVAGYQQDNLTYPDEPNFVGIRGIQQGGLSGMTLVDPGITANDLWCADDPYPQEFGTMGDDPEVYHLTRDNLGSTYDVNYNYYGFVTTTTGLPFPITSREALVYLVGDPRKVAYENTYNYVFESNRAAYLAAGKTTAQAETLAASDAAPIAETAWSGFNNIFHITEPAKPTPPVSGDPNYATLYAQWLRDVQTWQTQVSVFPWDLGLVNPDLMYSLQKKGSIGTYDAKNNNVHVGDTFSKGMYPALCNVRAPKNTIIAFCPHHPTDNPTVLPVVTLAGEANFVKPIMPRNFYAGDVYNTVPPTATAPNLPTPFSVATRRNANAQFQASISAASIKRFTAPIDWRLNKDTLTPHNGGTTNNAILDPPNDASSMPLVQTYHRVVNVAREINPAMDTYGYAWFDTGVEVGAGDIVLVAAKAKWGWGTNTFSGGRPAPDESVDPSTNQSNPARLWVVGHMGGSVADQYAKLLPDTKARKKAPASNTATLLFSADGDPVEGQVITSNLHGITTDDNYHFYNTDMLLPSYKAPRGLNNGALHINPHSLLVGTIGNPDLSDIHTRIQRVFALGSRGSHYVIDAEAPPGTTPTLRVTINDTSGAGDYADNNGWIEIWVAVCHRP